jgi:hypothetical protein
MRPGWVDSNVSKTLVSRYKKAPFSLDGLPYCGILGPAHALSCDRFGLMSRSPKEVSHPGREILVNLNSQRHGLARQRQDNFSVQDLSGIGECSPNIFVRYLREFRANLIQIQTIGHAPHNDGHRYPRSLDAWIAVMDLRINDYSVSPIRSAHRAIPSWPDREVPVRSRIPSIPAIGQCNLREISEAECGGANVRLEPRGIWSSALG